MRFDCNSLYRFDRPETIRDRAKMNLAGYRDWRLSENYIEPCYTESDYNNLHESAENSISVLCRDLALLWMS